MLLSDSKFRQTTVTYISVWKPTNNKPCRCKVWASDIPFRFTSLSMVPAVSPLKWSTILTVYIYIYIYIPSHTRYLYTFLMVLGGFFLHNVIFQRNSRCHTVQKKCTAGIDWNGLTV